MLPPAAVAPNEKPSGGGPSRKSSSRGGGGGSSAGGGSSRHLSTDRRDGGSSSSSRGRNRGAEAVMDVDVEALTLPVELGGCSRAGTEPVRGGRSVTEVRKDNQDAYFVHGPFMSQAGQLLLGVFDGHGAQGRPVAHLVRDAIPVALEKARNRAASPTASDHSSSSGDTMALRVPGGNGSTASPTASAAAAAASNGRSKKKPPPADDGPAPRSTRRAPTRCAPPLRRRKRWSGGLGSTTSFRAQRRSLRGCLARKCTWRGSATAAAPSAAPLRGGGGDAAGAGGGTAGSPAPSASPASTSSAGGGPPSASSAASSASRRQRFRAVDVSHDQKPVRPDEKKRVRDAGGRVARWRRNMGPLRVWQKDEWVPGLAMTRSIGDTCLSDCGVIPTPEVAYVRLNGADSFVVLASDGVWEFMTSQEVIDFVGKYRRQRRSAQSAADALVREAISRWRRNEAVVDDTTAVVLYLEWQHLRTPSGMPLPTAVAMDDGSSSVTGSGAGSGAGGGAASTSRRFFGGSSASPATSPTMSSIDGSPVMVVTADQPRLVASDGRLRRLSQDELLLAPM
eukprot:TRINITY_DN757_c0_g1_i8.p2 TRINITY_DN757_c0_g1~~TRINITY_DN757_c0_g1_i8.p2  ORF type:complete len:565 (+),score=170.03 TRINITY_DN757_c0_g1_i8:1625-3319(+)